MRSRKGFSLIELLLVIALMSVMTVILLARTNGLSSRAEADSAAQQIVGLFRQLRQMSVAIKVVDTGSLLDYPAYGAIFAPNGTIFTTFVDCDADDNNDGRLDNTDTWNVADCGSASTADLNMTLGNNARISDIKVYPTQGAAAVTPTSVSVQFLRPEPTLWITYSTGGAPIVISSGTVDITVRDKRSTDTAVVRIESSGLIYVR